MDQQAMAAARALAEKYMVQLRGDLVDVRLLMKAAMAGYLAGSGVPTDEAVTIAEQIAVEHLVGPVPASPMYHGLPWMVPGPASGAPYYD